MKYLLAIIILLHGLIHFMGFAKAFGYAEIKQLTVPISKASGTFWLIAALLFIITAVLFLLNKQSWWMVSLAAVIISQVVIITSWHDAKFGTIANIIILIAAIFGFTGSRFENSYAADVKQNLQRSNTLPDETLTAADMQHLPEPVQRVAHLLPMTPVVDLIKLAYAGVGIDGRVPAGPAEVLAGAGGMLLPLVVWTVAALVLGLRRFRWDPRS